MKGGPDDNFVFVDPCAQLCDLKSLSRLLSVFKRIVKERQNTPDQTLVREPTSYGIPLQNKRSALKETAMTPGLCITLTSCCIYIKSYHSRRFQGAMSCLYILQSSFPPLVETSMADFRVQPIHNDIRTVRDIHTCWSVSIRGSRSQLVSKLKDVSLTASTGDLKRHALLAVVA